MGRRGREPSDAEVNAVIGLYPDGAPLVVIATALDMTATRADQIINEAIGKAFATARKRGLVVAHFFD